MGVTKKLGIWMDYSMANLMEFTTIPFEVKIVKSNSFDTKNQLSLESNSMHLSNANQLLSIYYNTIANEIKNYDRIILFGPTNAKLELFDVLSEDERLIKTKFEIRDTDTMTNNEQYEFIKKYFTKK